MDPETIIPSNLDTERQTLHVFFFLFYMDARFYAVGMWVNQLEYPQMLGSQ